MIQKEFVIVYSHVPVHFNAYHNHVVENLLAFFCLTLHDIEKFIVLCLFPNHMIKIAFVFRVFAIC